ncbi:hypothetical protein WJX74_006113 [Apatococcus lobatus]|uniref:RING-type E3 ubiquitin transferase n=1 Tax=Apatococcus lobatus TaxID=904363 RepID=A0AAW1RSS5_9CHLO
MQASGVHADGFRRPVQQPGQHEELALTDRPYGRWTPTQCTPDSLKVNQVSESLGNPTFHGPNTFSQHQLEGLQLFIKPRLLAMPEEAEQQRHQQAEEQAQLDGMRQQQRWQELTETARPLQQPQQQAVGQPRALTTGSLLVFVSQRPRMPAMPASAALPTAPPWPEAETAETCPTSASRDAACQDQVKMDELAAQIGLTPPAKPSDALELGFTCSLTLEVFDDPVQASDGHTYEREAIEGWMVKNMTSPMTRQQLTPNLTANHALSRRIQAWEQAKEDYELAAALYESKVMELFSMGLNGRHQAVKASPSARMRFAIASEYPFGKAALYASRARHGAQEYLARGDKCLRKGDQAGAERWFGKAATTWPNNHECCFKLGRVLQEQQKTEAALIYLHQAVKAAAEGMPGSRHNFALGELLIRLGHLPEGSFYLQAAVALQPSQPLYQSALGVALFRQGMVKQSLAHLTQSVELLPGNAACQAQLGEALMSLKLHLQAEAALRKAVQIKPDNAAYQHSLGLALFSQGSVEAALTYYNEAIRLNSKSAATFASRGDAHLATGDKSAARTDFLTAARIDSGNPQYLYKLACALYSQNNLPEALHFAEEAVRLDGARNGMYQALAENLRAASEAPRQQSQRKCSIILA